MNSSFLNKVKSMLGVDFQRMFKSPLFYIMLGIAFVAPILITIMTSMMDGSVSVDPNTGQETVIEGFDNAWQILGSIGSLETSSEASTDAASSGMSLTAMCNINLMYMAIAVFVCLFISDDFRSGYAKNLFTVRSKKSDYVISKTVVGITAGALMLLCFFIGGLLGGAISNLTFNVEGVNAAGVIMSLLSKICVMGVFVPIFVAISVAAKQRAWLSICASLGGGMLLFMMIPMMTAPLDANFGVGIIYVLITLVGAVLFSVGLGVISNQILKKTRLV